MNHAPGSPPPGLVIPPGYTDTVYDSGFYYAWYAEKVSGIMQNYQISSETRSVLEKIHADAMEISDIYQEAIDQGVNDDSPVEDQRLILNRASGPTARLDQYIKSLDDNR